MTENNYGSGKAQVITEYEGSPAVCSSIVIDKTLIFAILSDEQFATLTSSMNHEQIEELTYIRSLSYSTLYHEFAHVHQKKLSQRMEWIKRFHSPSIIINEQCVSLGLIIWDEYFACRLSSQSIQIRAQDIFELIPTTISAEKDIIQKRKQYNERIVELNEFVKYFHRMTKFLLIKVAYIHGYLFSFPDESRSEMIALINNYYADTKLGQLWERLGVCFDELFKAFPNWESEQVFSDLSELIIKYYELFDIYLSQIDNGVYYDIPVRL